MFEGKEKSSITAYLLKAVKNNPYTEGS